MKLRKAVLKSALVNAVFVVAAILNFVVAPHRRLLGFYTLPTLFSAYFYGRRQATLTAVGSVHNGTSIELRELAHQECMPPPSLTI